MKTGVSTTKSLRRGGGAYGTRVRRDRLPPSPVDGGAGERLSVVRVDNDPVALAAAVTEADPSPEVVIEATYGWYLGG